MSVYASQMHPARGMATLTTLRLRWKHDGPGPRVDRLSQGYLAAERNGALGSSLSYRGMIGCKRGSGIAGGDPSSPPVKLKRIVHHAVVI